MDLEALEALPNRDTEWTGRYSVIRVVASYPARLHTKEVIGIGGRGDPDGDDGHPLAILNEETLETFLRDSIDFDDRLIQIKRKTIERLKPQLDEMQPQLDEMHPQTARKVQRLRGLTLPSASLEMDGKKISAKDCEDYLDCFKLLANRNLPERGRGQRQNDDSRRILLKGLLADYYIAGRSTSAAEIKPY